jgi:preprotein translocase subunit YajC
MYLLETAAQGDTLSSLFGLLAMPALVIGGMYFIVLRPQKNKEKAATQMRQNLEIGDEVITNGGVIGLVVNIKEDSVVIETGGDRSKIRVLKSAIAINRTVHDN